MSVPGAYEFVSPSRDEWLITEDSFQPSRVPHYETIFTLANGYAGVRGSIETSPYLSDPGFYIAGVYDSDGSPEMVNLPIWLPVEIIANGLRYYNLDRAKILEYRRTLDMKQGLLFTRIIWEDMCGQCSCWESVRLMHMVHKHLGLMWGSFTPLNYSGTVEFRNGINVWAVKYLSQSGHNHVKDIKVSSEENIGMTLETIRTGITVSIASALSIKDATRRVQSNDDKIEEIISKKVTRGHPVRFEKRVVFYSARDISAPETAARQEIVRFSGMPVKTLAEQHVAAWQKIQSDSDVKIENDPRAQKGLRFSIFHLSGLGNETDDRVSIGAKGLHGMYYSGGVFWETEIFVVPYYIFNRPVAAENLVMYRFHNLPDARENARQFGLHGAKFGFMIFDSGLERIRQLVKGGAGEQSHIVGDVAYAANQYCLATGDRKFYLEKGAVLLIETAWFWSGRFTWDKAKKKYVMWNLMGTDEFHSNVNNNAHTSHLAEWNLKAGIKVVDDLRKAGLWAAMKKEIGISDQEVARWSEIVGQVYLPFDSKKGIHEQFEGYFRMKKQKRDPEMTQMKYTGPVWMALQKTELIKQADTVLMYYLFHDDFPDKVKKAGWFYYEPRTTHASSLSRCIYAAVAARLGLPGAYKLFIESAEIDTGPNAECDNGIHAGCMGGTWQTAVMGFGGFRIKDGRPAFEPRLPKEWKSISYKIKWHGHMIEVSASHKILEISSGEKLEITSGGKIYQAGPKKLRIPL